MRAQEISVSQPKASIEAIEATRLPAITPGPGTRATAGRRPLVAVVRLAESLCLHRFCILLDHHTKSPCTARPRGERNG